LVKVCFWFGANGETRYGATTQRHRERYLLSKGSKERGDKAWLGNKRGLGRKKGKCQLEGRGGEPPGARFKGKGGAPGVGKGGNKGRNRGQKGQPGRAALKKGGVRADPPKKDAGEGEIILVRPKMREIPKGDTQKGQLRLFLQ